ncbi:MAG: VPLPA-CTERM sorting domain-containing protein [Gammaproteobacteria bacterium]|nr:VPLPA-CTERM sorting domain-containing protein [Gammaproteobacteria bacterium]
MNKSNLYVISLFTVLSTHFITSACAAIVVYTDRVAWEAAALVGPLVFDHFHEQDFENIPTGSFLSDSDSGIDFLPLGIIVSGAPGFNAIDNSSTADPYSNMLSPNGSTYYLGDVNIGASVEPVLTFPELDFLVTGFGADWVIQGDLVMEVQGVFIPFNTYLETGSGFLGVIIDRPNPNFMLEVNLSGSAVFGMDNVITANAPIPAAVWLFGSGLIGLVGFAKRKKA